MKLLNSVRDRVWIKIMRRVWVATSNIGSNRLGSGPWLGLYDVTMEDV